MASLCGITLWIASRVRMQMNRARISGLHNRSELNDVVVRVESCVGTMFKCFHGDVCLGVKKENLVFACVECCVIKTITAVETVFAPDLLLCESCTFAKVSKSDLIRGDIDQAVDMTFNRPIDTFTMLTSHGSEDINLRKIMTCFYEQIMCGYAEADFYIEPLLFLGEGEEEVKFSSDLALHILTDSEQVNQASRIQDVAVFERIQHEPVTVTFERSRKKFALEYWGFRNVDGSDGHHLGGLLPLALSNVMRFDMLWCSVYVRHMPYT